MIKPKTTLLALALAGLAAAASVGGALAQDKATIGIAMPTKYFLPGRPGLEGCGFN